MGMRRLLVEQKPFLVKKASRGVVLIGCFYDQGLRETRAEMSLLILMMLAALLTIEPLLGAESKHTDFIERLLSS